MLLDIRDRIRQKTFSSLRLFGGKQVNAYWWDKTENFGDLLTPLLLKYYGLTPVQSSMKFSDVISIGSILDRLTEDYTGYIIGSGLMYDHVRTFRKARLLAVRGGLTRDRIGAPVDTLLGDPGLLASNFLNTRKSKEYALGIVLHYVDKNDQRIQKVHKKYPKDIFVIDAQRDPLDVIIDFDKCNAILSSSLHGIVVSDSLGIPNAWVCLSDKVLGGGFKFLDYFSVFNNERSSNILTGDEGLSNLLDMTRRPPASVEKIRSDLDGAFHKFCNEILPI